MSGEGAPELHADGRGLRIVIVVAEWHGEVTGALLAGAQRALSRAGAPPAEIVRVPGAFELPVAAARVLRSPRAPDGVVALGSVVRGGTPHFEYVCGAVADGLGSVAVSTGVPVGFGVLTCDTEEQAVDRAGLPGSSEDKGAEAADAVLATIRALGDW
ncbi:6,7-dimethyl-8-ribityllumazine synthase [Gulosibacter sp. 10]|uniref:6,7-dimethyl-8-ribityllumazine synthase n=1 Tax=Gulosibacter sp. 10 TaxID=1255570 RepID=UPI00097ECADD|nr:6,7-dimethyl-8-ribityllumazine synthase [Gulosibacter sp. 10]SJM66612.1 6,7-dimethyl-8-ribityllumazine synthase [Gulosibacter sp. 10]